MAETQITFEFTVSLDDAENIFDCIRGEAERLSLEAIQASLVGKIEYAKAYGAAALYTRDLILKMKIKR
jgi:hypothetical protein